MRRTRNHLENIKKPLRITINVKGGRRVEKKKKPGGKGDDKRRRIHHLKGEPIL